MNKLLAHDIYIKELMQLNVGAMSRVKYNRHKTVNVDTESSGINTEEEDAENAADDCEHEECHRVECKREQWKIEDDGSLNEREISLNLDVIKPRVSHIF